MALTFQNEHGAMLLKYSGISFISGAVNHGFFSGERSLWTALIGMVLFVLGAWLEHRWHPVDTGTPRSGLLKTLALGSLLSIGLGFFTGGLQHFPDSPERSAWVVPLGFFVSVFALGLTAPRSWTRAASTYVLVLGMLTATGSWGAWQWLKLHPQWAATGHHDHTGSASGGVDDAPLVAQVVSRTMAVHMDDGMRFSPNHMAVNAGETIRFVVTNSGRTSHELVLGREEDIRAHAAAMKQAAATGQSLHGGQSQGSGHDHGTGIAIALAAGQTGDLIVTFPKAVTLQMACLIPGHFEAGMRGTLTVNAEARAPAAPDAAQHDHGAHRH
jgi:uncharacterized cupredoxin-like copper-binding protein